MEQPACRPAWAVLLGTAAFSLAAAVAVVFGPHARLVMYVALCVLWAVYTTGALRQARNHDLQPRTRAFWGWAAAGGVCLVTGAVVQLCAAFGLWPGAMGPMLATKTFAVAGVAAITWPMLTWPLDVPGRRRLRVALDAATVMCGVAVFTWALAHARGAMPVDAVDLVLTLLASGVVVVSAFAMVRLVLGGSAPFGPAAGATGTSALLLLAIGIATDGLTGPQPDARLLFTTKLISGALLAVTPQVERITHPAGAPVPPPRRLGGALPYLAVAAAQVLLIVQLWRHGLDVTTWGVVVGMAVITALVTVRQKVTATDNERLIDELDATMASLSAQERRFRSLVQNTSDVTLVVDRAGDVVYASPSLHSVLGVSPQEAVGRPACGVLRAHLPGDGGHGWPTHLSSRPAHREELCVRQPDGTVKYLELVSRNLLDDPSVHGVVINLRDVTEAKDLQRRLRHQATHDSLTGLANRTLLNEQLSAQDRIRGSSAVLLLDLDGFKEVNDRFGHHVGDELLVVVAERLRKMVRPDDLVARLGGDEFVVLLRDSTAQAAVSTAERILSGLAAVASLDGRSVRVRGSVGVAAGTDTEFDTLLRRADEAMYQAKRSGAGVAVFGSHTASARA
ncbi:hypothetical protein Cme02nite_33390 [Catellatospora methionotrophica]|uniref:Diguanylate cyclase n=1 Tax=Catellatospora methionotrophica TaxID=121620 RepID=A0A8J3L9Q0_9ACTN|nr:sensor domain-containing diguanylate cyclase [Catellatospora methionotrophica]GIG15007.1 hypothetical protein Cme02nite_33390 [Catellatospora methionotrophica]